MEFGLKINGLRAVAWHLEQGEDNGGISRLALALFLRSLARELEPYHLKEQEERDMWGYQVTIWMPVYHNTKFSHSIPRYEVVHARSKAEAEALVSLKPGTTTVAHEGLTITTEDEYIKGVRCLGRVVYETRATYKKRELETLQAERDGKFNCPGCGESQLGLAHCMANCRKWKEEEDEKAL